MINETIINEKNNQRITIQLNQLSNPYTQASILKATLYSISQNQLHQDKLSQQTTIPFAVTDTMNLIQSNSLNTITHILFIDEIWVPKHLRKQNIGTNLINKLYTITSQLIQQSITPTTNYITLVNAGAHSKEYETQPNISELKKYIKKVEKFYIKNGFINVNRYIAQYETKQAMLKQDAISTPLLDIIITSTNNSSGLSWM